jgi:hypothetical protein
MTSPLAESFLPQKDAWVATLSLLMTLKQSLCSKLHPCL